MRRSALARIARAAQQLRVGRGVRAGVRAGLDRRVDGGAHRRRRRAARARRRRDPSAARIRSGDAGSSWIQAPVASWIAATTAGAPTSIGSSPTPFAPCGAPLNGASTRIVVIRGASSAVGMMYVASRSFR